MPFLFKNRPIILKLTLFTVSSLSTLAATNSAPTITQLPDQKLIENTTGPEISILVGDRETPANNLRLVAYTGNSTLMPVSGILLGGSGANRTLRLKPAPNQTGSCPVSIGVFDSNGGINRTLFTVKVVPNTPPTISPIANQNMIENSISKPVPFTIGDAETPTSNLRVVTYTSNEALMPKAGILLGGFGANRSVSFRPNPNQSGTCDVSIAVYDDNKGVKATKLSLTIAPNTPPIISQIPDVTMLPNQDRSIRFSVSDVETTSQDIKVDFEISPALWNIMYGGSFTIDKPGNGQYSINYFRPKNDGTISIKVIAKDPHGGETNSTFRINILPNEPPIISPIANQSVNKNEIIIVPFKTSDKETPNNRLKLQVIPSNPSLIATQGGFILNGSGEDRTIALKPTANQTGICKITIETQDENLATSSRSFNLTVNEPSSTMVFNLSNTEKIPLELKLIPAGSFLMGRAPNEIGSENNEDFQHLVTFEKPFYMGTFEVTQAQWTAILGNNPVVEKNLKWVGANSPVTVEWSEIRQATTGFLDQLNAATASSRPEGMEFRLPSEAEWEYACRAGMTSRYYWGGDSNYGLLQNHAYTTYYTYPNTFTGPRMTGLLLPNNFGLYDMCGNVMEWCEDDWHDNYLGAPTDGSAWVNGPNPSREHPLRGGFFYSTYEQLRSSSRSNSAYWPGFRVVLAAPKKP